MRVAESFLEKLSFWKNDGFPHLPIIDDPVELLSSLVYPVPVRAVHDEYEPLSAGVIVTPERSDLVLASNILTWNNLTLHCLTSPTQTYPDVKFNIFVRDCLYIEADCRYCID